MMEIAIKIISKIPGDALKISCLILMTSIFFMPLILIKKRSQNSVYKTLKNTKIALEIKKLVLEIDDKINPRESNLPKLGEDRSKYYLENGTRVHFPIEQNTEHVRYYDKIRFGILGSFFFFFTTTMAMLIAAQQLESSIEWISYFSKEIGVSIASGFIATFVPWGNRWSYFTYGFFIPIQIALMIVLLI
ncbi:hypothetical protein WJR50_26120 [Catalinimonas sp. 4WD22]|uniref:hypothetical protein n=1 Tax=Catalinimonas locisalis TaxID=3133978 RepID=UPI003101B1F0